MFFKMDDSAPLRRSETETRERKDTATTGGNDDLSEANRMSIIELERFVFFSLKLCQDLSQMWVSGDLAQKQKFQKIMFPEGLNYGQPNSTYRTLPINSLIAQTANLARVSGGN